MSLLEKVTGLVLAAILTIINKAVFEDEPAWKHYSAFINVTDVIAVIYVCYFSSWGRNRIFAWHLRSKMD